MQSATCSFLIFLKLINDSNILIVILLREGFVSHPIIGYFFEEHLVTNFFEYPLQVHIDFVNCMSITSNSLYVFLDINDT